MSRSSSRAIIAVTLWLLPVVLSGQGASDADVKELAAYRLTIETLKKVQVATRAMLEEMKKDPKVLARMTLEAEIDALEKKEEPTEAETARLTKLQDQRDAMASAESDDLGDVKTLSDMEARMRAFPAMATSLARAGIAPREYAKFTLAMFQAALVASFKKAGLAKDLPPGVSAENVKFVEAHEAELTAMQEEFGRLGKGLDR